MKLFLVRRTRTFIKDNFALTDESNGRKYLQFPDGSKSTYLPDFPSVPDQLRARLIAADRAGESTPELFGMYFDKLLPYAEAIPPSTAELSSARLELTCVSTCMVEEEPPIKYAL